MKKILFLGTGTSTGVPLIGCDCEVCRSNNPHDKRLRSSVLISEKGTDVLIDCGPDFRQQALMYNIKKLDSILLTHEHYDHVSGLDELRPLRKAIVFAEKRVLDAVKHGMPYNFNSTPYMGAPEICLEEISPDLHSIIVGGLEFEPIRLIHGQLPILGYRFGRVAYLTDFSSIEESEMSKLNGVETLIICALRQLPHLAHLNLEQALDFVKRINPQRAYFTHFSHGIGLSEEVQKSLPKNVIMAYDGLEIEV